MSKTRHKIVLYNPKTVFYDMPLALLALGSCFDKSNYDILIIDGRIEKDAHNRVIREVKDALCFGLTILTGNPIQDAIQITRKVKKHAPEVPTIWGGWHTSLFPLETLEEEKSIDITVQGQGELTFQELVAAFEKQSTLSGIKGICYRNFDGEIVKNSAREMKNMDDLPPADYSLIDVDRYFEKKGRRQLDYISSVGCLYRCTFCADPFVFKRKFSAIGAERIVNEIETLYNEYAFTDVNFQDETFFTYKDRILSMAEGFLDRKVKISWAATLRADQGDRLSQENFHLLSQSGLRRVLVGVESGSQGMMDWLKKDINVAQVFTTAKKCIASNIFVQFPFIVGFPGESDMAFSKSIEMAIDLGNLSDTFEIIIFYFKPYPGSAITTDVEKNGYQMPSNLKEWSEFDYISSSGPWITKKRIKEIEILKFYFKLSRSQHKVAYPLKWIARKRLKHKQFGFPVEKRIINTIKPAQKLS